jgi:glycosyltransferase involved in cell wall biosynthesis
VQPQVLILLATRNGAEYLPEQLDSIARQSYTSWRIVAADDGSTDETMAILNRFGQERPGRIEVLPNRPVHSAKENFFRLLRESPEAEYFALCDQDDVWHDRKLERLVEECVKLEDSTNDVPCLVHSDLAVVNSRRELIAASFMKEMNTDPARVTLGSALMENSIPGCSMLLNASVVRAFREYEGPLDDAVMHDWWVGLVARALGRVGFVPEPLVLYRQHAGNTLGSVHRGGVRFIVRKLLNIRRGNGDALYRQGLLLMRTYSERMPYEHRRVLAAFSEFDRLGKLQRIQRCVSRGILKQTLWRRIYQLIQI